MEEQHKIWEEIERSRNDYNWPMKKMMQSINEQFPEMRANKYPVMTTGKQSTMPAAAVIGRQK